MANTQYTIGFFDDFYEEYFFIGWNQDTDYYEAVQVSGLDGATEDWCFVETNDDNEEIDIFRENTFAEADSIRADAQAEFDETIEVIELKQDTDGLWYPV